MENFSTKMVELSDGVFVIVLKKFEEENFIFSSNSFP